MTGTARRPGGREDPFDREDFERLRYHRAIAISILTDPSDVVPQARANLERLLDSSGAQRPELEEWKRLLNDVSLQDVIEAILEESEEGRKLRESSPFKRILNEAEMLEVFRRRHGGSEY